MGGSAAEIPTPSKAQPAIGSGLRASDAEREQVAARLRDEFVAGRLSHETFVLRMHAVLEAKNLSDLPPLVADLPARQPPASGQPPPDQPSVARSLVGRLRGAWSRMRGPADAGQLARPQARTPGHPGPAGLQPDGTPIRVSIPKGRGVTIGMQLAEAESRPMSLRFPRGGEGEFSIGRDASCDLAIPDMTVSRRHATLERTDEGWILTDLASTNGTRVNGWRVRGRVQVRAGDLVTFGSAETVLIREDDLLAADAPRTPRVAEAKAFVGAVNPCHVLGSLNVTTVLLVRHGLTAATGHVLTGWTPGVGLDDRGRAQARALGARLASVPLDAVVTSPLDRCRQTVAELLAARNGQASRTEPVTDERVGECLYGDWTGKPLKELEKDPLWPVVQAHPSAVRFPGEDGETFLDMQHRAVSAIRDWNAKLGQDATYLVCSHGDVIKAIVADALGLHLDQCQRIVADPCSLTVIRYTPLRPFLLRLNDTGGGVADLLPRPPQAADAAKPDGHESDAVIGGGAGGATPAAPGDTEVGTTTADALVGARSAGPEGPAGQTAAQEASRGANATFGAEG